MTTVLRRILAQKHREISALKQEMPLRSTGPAGESLRDFRRAISGRDSISLIGEIKFASPSAGMIPGSRICGPIRIGKMYEKAGATAISVLTDRAFFQGERDHLRLVKRHTSLPVLRKDFILDAIQVHESLLYGADAVLLIARILSFSRLARLLEECRALGLAALTEVHSHDDVRKAVACGSRIIGINNRDLDTLAMDIETTRKLAPWIPEEHVLVSASGFESAEDIESVKGLGVEAVLVGSSLMRSSDPERKARELISAGRPGFLELKRSATAQTGREHSSDG